MYTYVALCLHMSLSLYMCVCTRQICHAVENPGCQVTQLGDQYSFCLLLYVTLSSFLNLCETQFLKRKVRMIAALPNRAVVSKR